MKTFVSIIITIILFLFVTDYSSAQEKSTKITTSQFKVDGVCNMCKTRIENAALIKGVKKVEWDKHTKVLKVVYNNTKTTENAIHKSVAQAGYDTEKVKATEKAYKKLPACCAYRDGVEVH
ncbi:MAG: ATPase [Bacteroidales bacterium]|nr:ATPase [Bacteroidales bacterium]